MTHSSNKYWLIEATTDRKHRIILFYINLQSANCQDVLGGK